MTATLSAPPVTSACVAEGAAPSTVDVLVAAVRRDPSDRLARGALYDKLCDDTGRPLTARRRVNLIVREAEAAHALDAARAAVTGPGARAARSRTAVRAAVGRGRNGSIPVVVVAGDAAPLLSGVEAHSTFRNGGACHSPGAAIKAGYRVDYHPSTLTVTVGAGWVLAHCR